MSVTGASPPKPVEVHRTRDHRLAIIDRVFLVVWERETTMAGIDRIRAGLRGLAAGAPESVGLLTVIAADAAMPGSDERRGLAAVLADFGREIKVSAVAVEGTGFRAAAVRSIITGLTLVARQPFPHRIFANVADAAAWMAPQLPAGAALDAGKLADAVAAARASS